MKFPVRSSVYKYRVKERMRRRIIQGYFGLLSVAIGPVAFRMGRPFAGFLRASTYQSVVVTIN